jgi:hypothetical protein
LCDQQPDALLALNVAVRLCAESVNRETDEPDAVLIPHTEVNVRLGLLVA